MTLLPLPPAPPPMKLQFLVPILCCSLVLLSCGKKELEDDDAPVEEAVAERPVNGRSLPDPPALKDNPFAVPNVTNDLPDDADLGPGTVAPSGPVSIPSGLKDSAPATVTVRPPTDPPTDPPANDDSEE